jgi:hypothetical protein
MGRVDIPALIRGGVAKAKAILGDAVGGTMATVIHTPAIGEGTYAAELGDPVERQAIVLEAVKPIRMADGIDRISIAQLTFLEPVTVTEHDQFTLPSGRTWPVLQTRALLDPNGQPYMTKVWLGS